MWKKRGNETTIKDVVLRNLNVTSTDQINEWYRKSISGNYFVKNIKKVAAFLKELPKNTRILIVGDYDADGITSTTILVKTLNKLDFKNVSYVIPLRFSEGFGINSRIVTDCDADVVITCDNGIAQLDEIKKLKELGKTVVVIDHHEPVIMAEDMVLPEADIIVDPHTESESDFKGYCGAGLCYKLAQELFNNDSMFMSKIISIAAIGTVADVMPITEENYFIIRQGIKYLQDQNTTTTGAYALVSAFELNSHLTSTDIGFSIAPAINAASRMDENKVNDAINLLIFDEDYQSAVYQAHLLVELNKERKEEKKKALKIVKELLESDKSLFQIPMVLYIPNTKEGIIGIIAGSLCEEYNIPCVVLTDAVETGVLKGSARSCGNYNIKEELDKVSDLLLKYGGHEGAAGLSLKKDNLFALKQGLAQNAKGFVFDESDSKYYDLEISAEQIAETVDELQKFEPFGEGNPKPIFKITNFECIDKFKSGSTKKVLAETIVKLNSKKYSAIGFDMADKMDFEPSTLNLYGTVSNNYFRGNVERQVEFCDFEPV